MIGVYDSTLRNYLLGSLPENEVEVYDERIFDDDEFAARVLMVEDDLIDAYVRGELTAEERVRFQASYLVSPYRREQVLFAHFFQNIFEQKEAVIVPVSVTLRDKVKYMIVRLARWAGWLYFVDQDLLDGYINSYKSRIDGRAA